MKGCLRLGAVLPLFAGLASVACGGSESSDVKDVVADPSVAPATLVASSVAAARIDDVQARFRFIEREQVLVGAARGVVVPRTVKRGRSVLAPSVVTGFDSSPGALAGTHVRANMPNSVRADVVRPANVDLPRNAVDAAVVEDTASHMRVRFALKGASPAPATVGNGYALYTGAIQGADLVQRVHAEGTEDYVVFENKPANEDLAYDVDVSEVPGLRLVGNSLEFLNAEGSPTLRVASPYVVDAAGKTHTAKLSVDGCAVDTNGADPWGRAVTAPGSKSCTVHVSWGNISYPAVVDPSWTATGSMATGRFFHASTVLSNGKVLVAGGQTPDYYDTNAAELYNPATGTWAATGGMSTSRSRFTTTLLPEGKVLAAAGNGPEGWWDLIPINTAEIYNPTTGTWSNTGSLAKVHADHTATLLSNGKVLLHGGFDMWESGPDAQLFNPATGTWGSAGTPIFADRNRHTATVLANGNVLLAGGDAGYASGQTNEIYNVSTNTYSSAGTMASARSWHTAALLSNGKVLIAGGFPGSFTPLSSAALYDPATNSFSATGSMSVSRFGATATTLPSGLVLVAGGQTRPGGYNYNIDTASADLFNSATGTFSATNSLGTPRSFHTTSDISGPSVLVAGGQSTFIAYSLASAEKYNP
jgi:hypothetical protein